MTMTSWFTSPLAPSGPATILPPSYPASAVALPIDEAGVSETPEQPDDAFGRLARLVASNDRHLAELTTLNAKLTKANAYLCDPLARPSLARAYRDRVVDRRNHVLTILRANRIAAREFLPRDN